MDNIVFLDTRQLLRSLVSGYSVVLAVARL